MSWLPILMTIVASVIASLAGPIQDFVTTHPNLSVVIGGLVAILNGLFKSPITKK